MTNLAPLSALIVAVLGLAAFALGTREARRLHLADPERRTTASANARQIRNLGVLLLVSGLTSLLILLFSPR